MMEQKEITLQIKEEAINRGLCQMWQQRIHPDMTMDELAYLYTSGYDFCMTKDVPNIDFFRQHLKGNCEKYGVYVDDSVADINIKKIFLLGDTNASLHYDGGTARVFVKHNSSCAVMAMGCSNVTIYAYDNAKVVVSADKSSKVYVITHGDSVNISNVTPDHILIRKKNNNTLK